MRSIHIFFSILLLAMSAWAGPVKAPHISVELVSEQQSVQPGARFDLGLKFVLEPGWHLYWINPGDSGEPPEVRWTLPSGVKAGDILWPYPERAQLQSIVNYVYSDQMLLPVPMQATEIKGSSLPIAADVRWLVCRDVCIPGKATVKLDLPINQVAERNAGEVAAFTATRSRIPQPLPPGARARTLDDGKRFIMTISPLPSLKGTDKAEFFPLAPEEVDNSAMPGFESSGGGLRISLVKSDQLLKPIRELSGVLVLSGGKSYVIHSPVTQSATGRPHG